MMELRHLKHFIALARERNVTRAAASEHIVQSGLSSSIAALERELGSEVYVRGSRPIRLTLAGEALLPHAESVIDAARSAVHAVREASQEIAGPLAIGVPRIPEGQCPAADWVAGFQAENPSVRVRVVLLDERSVPNLRPGGLDVAFAYSVGEPAMGTRSTMPLSSEPIALAMAPSSPFASRSLSPGFLEDVPFVETPVGWPTRTATDALFEAVGVSRHIVMESENLAMIADLVRSLDAVAFLPRNVIQAAGLATANVVGLAIRGQMALMVSARSSETSPAARAFAEFVRRTFRGDPAISVAR